MIYAKIQQLSLTLTIYSVKRSGGDITGKSKEIIGNNNGSNGADENITMDIVEEVNDKMIGDCVSVIYNNANFPGEVTDIKHGDLYVSVMHKSGKFWKWPEFGRDKIWYTVENVVKKINPPVVAGNRGQFSFGGI